MDTNVKRKKALFILQLPPPIHGVSMVGSYIQNSQLINNAFHCSFVNLSTSTSMQNLQSSSFLKYVKTIKIYWSVLHHLLFNRFELCYITLFPYGFSFYKDAGIICLCKLFGYKPLIHLHTYGFKTSSRKSWWTNKLYRFVFKNTQAIILSERLKEDIDEIYSGQVIILPNGIPAINTRNDYVADQSPVTILYFSHLVKGKGILLLLEALEIVKAKGYSFHLRVAGDEFDLTYDLLKRKIKEKDLVNEVSLLGSLYNEEKYTEFRKAGIFILPSNYDTFGLVLLEAMQFGVPCIASHIGAIPDVLGEGRGVLLENLQPETIAQSIIDLLSNPERRKKMSEAGFNYFNAHYTSRVFETNFLAILNDQSNKTIKNKT